MARQQGAALIVVLVLLAASSLMATAAVRDLGLQQRLVAATTDSRNAYNAALHTLSAGISTVRAQLPDPPICADPHCGWPSRDMSELHPGHDWRAGQADWWTDQAETASRGHYRVEAGGALTDPDTGAVTAHLFRIVARGQGLHSSTSAIVAATYAIPVTGGPTRRLSRQRLR